METIEKEDLIKNYFEKIRNDYNDKHYRNLGEGRECLLKKYLRLIVNNNLDYILTDSFIDHLTLEKDFLMDLSCINYDIHTRIAALMGYFDKIFLRATYLRDSKPDANDKSLYYALLDEDIKNAVEYVVSRMHDLAYMEEMTREGLHKLYGMIFIVFSYYLLNNKEGNIYEMCDIFLNNPIKMIDSTCVNDIPDCNIAFDGLISADRLIDFVIYKLNNKSSTIEIR